MPTAAERSLNPHMAAPAAADDAGRDTVDAGVDYASVMQGSGLEAEARTEVAEALGLDLADAAPRSQPADRHYSLPADDPSNRKADAPAATPAEQPAATPAATPDLSDAQVKVLERAFPGQHLPTILASLPAATVDAIIAHQAPIQAERDGLPDRIRQALTGSPANRNRDGDVADSAEQRTSVDAGTLTDEQRAQVDAWREEFTDEVADALAAKYEMENAAQGGAPADSAQSTADASEEMLDLHVRVGMNSLLGEYPSLANDRASQAEVLNAFATEWVNGGYEARPGSFQDRIDAAMLSAARVAFADTERTAQANLMTDANKQVASQPLPATPARGQPHPTSKDPYADSFHASGLAKTVRDEQMRDMNLIAG